MSTYTKTRPIILLKIIIFFSSSASAQVSLKEIGLHPGHYLVGFRHETAFDSTRLYKRSGDWNNLSIPRPIPLSVWYPADLSTVKTSPVKVLDYMKVLKEEEEWEYLPDDRILDWFSYSNTANNRAHLNENSQAYKGVPAAKGKFPVIIYAASYQASSIENFALCELLASHGYLVIASPSRGTETRMMGAGTEKDMDTQARDIEYLIARCSYYPSADDSKIATMGFSFGGLSNVLSQIRNAKIKAIVSLDGSIRYQYATLKKSAYANIEKMDVPFLHMAQKDIPAPVLAEDKLDSALNNKFEFYDDLIYSEAYSFKFHHMTHAYFSTLGVLFQERDKRQDKSDQEIMTSYRWTAIYALNFLNAYLMGDKKSLAFIQADPTANGVSQGLISQRYKAAKATTFSFEDFNELAAAQEYSGLQTLYKALVAKHPEFKPDEGKFNNLGLQLLFNKKTSQHGVNVLLLGTSLYPASANLFDSLAEGYLFTSQKSLAKKAFQTSLKLDPRNENAIHKLKELK